MATTQDEEEMTESIKPRPLVPRADHSHDEDLQETDTITDLPDMALVQQLEHETRNTHDPVYQFCMIALHCEMFMHYYLYIHDKYSLNKHLHNNNA